MHGHGQEYIHILESYLNAASEKIYEQVLHNI